MNRVKEAESIFDALGVRRVINGHHWRTALGGSVMSPEVVQAMADSAGCFVDLEELYRRAGEYIASITGAEAGMVTAGCAAAQVLQAAACMTGLDEAKMARLPNASGMKNEVIIQKSHRNYYDNCFRLAGATLVEIGDGDGTARADLDSAITDSTAAVAYAWHARFRGLDLEQVVRAAHARDVPVVVDAAAELPPVENLTRFISLGADLVAFSGGKGVRGPQSTGILAGRRDLVKAAFLNTMSSDRTWAGIGRPMKVSKEEIVGLVKALEMFVEADHETEWAEWRATSASIIEALEDIRGLTTYLNEGPVYPGPAAPTATVVLDKSWRGPSADAVAEALVAGDPPIYIGTGPKPEELWVAPATLQEGEAEFVADRLRQVLTTTG